MPLPLDTSVCIDLLIAGYALALQASVATRNADEFERVPGLTVARVDGKRT
jgi:predicted nucleic acid-binding protein